MDPVLGEIQCFGGNFAPVNYAYCNGQLISIAENTALFSLIGTTYGGDGQVTFALPDFRSRMAVGANQGQGPGLQPIELGQMAGAENLTLNSTNLPSHFHTLASARIAVNSANGDTSSPVGGVIAAHTTAFAESFGPNQNLAQSVTGQTGVSGSNQPFPIRIPYLGLNFIIAVQGIYPSRN